MKKLICSPILWLVLTAVFLLTALLSEFHIAAMLLSILSFLTALFMMLKQTPALQSMALILNNATEKALQTADFSDKTVMVGTVRTAEQLDYCLKTGCYYVPAQVLQDAPFPTLYIALHEEEIGTQPGIRWYGEINTVELVKRSTIPVSMRPDADPNEIYYLYTVKSWQERKPAISISGTRRGRPRFTGKFLFDHCSKSYQLFSVASEQEFRLLCTLDHIYETLYTGKTLDASYRLSENHLLTVKGCHLYITNNHGWIREKTSFKSFMKNPGKLFLKAKQITKE